MRIKTILAVSCALALPLMACSEVADVEVETSEQQVAEAPTPQFVAADGTPIAAPGCEYGQPHPNAPAELEQFAFLIGDYTIQFHAWNNGSWTPPQPGRFARWNGRYGLGGMAIYDEWIDPDPAIDPAAGRGVNVRFYDGASEEWKMMWIHTQGAQVQDLRAEMRDGTLTMWQVYPERPNFLATFETVDDNNWHRISYIPDEAGEWVPQFKIAATRVPCP